MGGSDERSTAIAVTPTRVLGCPSQPMIWTPAGMVILKPGRSGLVSTVVCPAVMGTNLEVGVGWRKGVNPNVFTAPD